MTIVKEIPVYSESSQGNRRYYLPSKGPDYLHRLDGPAIESADGSKEWYINNKRHRLDGPAMTNPDGAKSWWINGKRHRLNGPAIIHSDGSEIWFVDDKAHRLDGPAFEDCDGYKGWWINGKKLDDEEVELWLEENSIDLSAESGQLAFKLQWT